VCDEEKEFQRQLDKESYLARDTRLVFADWLQDKNDPRAEGYRILAAQGIYTNHYNIEPPYSRTWRRLDPHNPPSWGMPHQIPAAVFDVLPQPYTQICRDWLFKTYASRRLAEVAAMYERDWWRPDMRDEDWDGVVRR
jgi:uncharacterized protein (TIGR02996 family)